MHTLPIIALSHLDRRALPRDVPLRLPTIVGLQDLWLLGPYPLEQHTFLSIGDYFTFSICKPPPTPIAILWRRPWRIAAPEFLIDDDEDEAALPSLPRVSAPSLVRFFTRFGEFATLVLGIHSSASTVHVSWVEKTPTINGVPSHRPHTFHAS